MLGADARVVEAGGDGVGFGDLAVLVLEQERLPAVDRPRDAPADGGPAFRLDSDEAGAVSAKPAKVPAALDPPPTQATTRSGSAPSRLGGHCSAASRPTTRWNSRTIQGYGWGPITDPRQ